MGVEMACSYDASAERFSECDGITSCICDPGPSCRTKDCAAEVSEAGGYCYDCVVDERDAEGDRRYQEMVDEGGWR